MPDGSFALQLTSHPAPFNHSSISKHFHLALTMHVVIVPFPRVCVPISVNINPSALAHAIPPIAIVELAILPIALPLSLTHTMPCLISLWIEDGGGVATVLEAGPFGNRHCFYKRKVLITFAKRYKN